MLNHPFGMIQMSNYLKYKESKYYVSKDINQFTVITNLHYYLHKMFILQM